MEMKWEVWEKPVMLPLHMAEKHSNGSYEKDDDYSMPFNSIGSCFPGRTVQGKPCQNGNHP